MEINIINYILDKQKTTQEKLAGMLKQENNKSVNKSTISRWKNGSEKIPLHRFKELNKIARSGSFADGHKKQWLEITGGSKKIADDWYWKFAEFIMEDNSIWLDEQYGKVNYDSIWIEHIQRMLITLNDAGIPVKDLNFTFDATREPIWEDDAGEYDQPIGWEYTPADELIIPYIKTYLALRKWSSWHITNINNKNIAELQYELALKVNEIALYNIPLSKFKDVGTDIKALKNYIKNSRFKALELISQFSNKLEYYSLTTGVDENFDYFRFINNDIDSLDADCFKHPAYIEKHGTQDSKKSNLDIFADETQQKILDGIENNEKLLKENNKLLKDQDKLLKEILENLNNNNNNNNGEVNGK
ncbi:hypothetical protein OAK33_01695 [Candidatus Thioglobus sp.]|nr:hypothetical protein [Candidatus Thioglobus sp.]